MADAILLLSFGGPDGPEDVMPFLENVTRGRNIPRERLEEVAEHYLHFGGRSPINDQNRELLQKLRNLLQSEGPDLPVYWGNRNWHPLLADTLRQMKEDGITRVFVFVTSAFSSYSGCRQYLENLSQAQKETGFENLEILKLRAYFNHPGFLEPLIDHTKEALSQLPNGHVIFTAHSIPLSMAQGSRYEAQLQEASRLVADACSVDNFDLVWQSRSGAPQIPWLEPDILDHLRALSQRGVHDVVIVPIGFVSDHMEVLYDLDTEARELCEELGINMKRVATTGSDNRFIAMIRDLVMERQNQKPGKFLGVIGLSPDVCDSRCCPAPVRPGVRPTR